MNKLFCLLCSLFFISLLNAQIGFDKGYLINNGVRIECYIKNLDWRNNPSSFKYKLAESDSEIRTGTIETVSEFGLDNGSKYKRFTLKIERSANHVSELESNRNPEWKIETLFLETLIEGDATLYSYCEGALFKYFYAAKNKPTEQLVHITYFDINQRAMAYNDIYKQQLFNSFSDANFPSRKFENLDYTRSSLIGLFTEYNAGKSIATVNYVEKDKRKSYNLKLTARVSQASVAVTEYVFSYNHDTETDPKLVAAFGIEGEYIFAFNKNKWSIFTNPVYTSFQVEKNYIVSSGVNNNTELTNLKVDYTSIEIPVGLRHYFFLNKSSRIFVNAAYIVETNLNSTIAFNPGKTIKIVPKSNFGFGIGYNYKRFGGEVRFNTPRELIKNDVSAFSTKYKSVGFTLSFTVL